MLYIVFYFSFLVAIIVLFIYGLYSCHKASKEEEKEWKEFLISLTLGSKWKLQKESNGNPFDDPDSDIIVTIIEIRKNSSGDIWVQYRYKDTGELYERQASDFKKLYIKLN